MQLQLFTTAKMYQFFAYHKIWENLNILFTRQQTHLNIYTISSAAAGCKPG